VPKTSLLRLVWLIGLLEICCACATLPVEGEFFATRLEGRDPTQTILIIFNHGYSPDKATTFPPILQRATTPADDVVLFSQVRNFAALKRDDHRRFIETAIAWFHSQYKIPVEQIILAGQSCGGWGALETAA